VRRRAQPWPTLIMHEMSHNFGLNHAQAVSRFVTWELG
jgi:hypothetical protein